MNEFTAKRVLLKNKEGEYLLPKVAVANTPEEGNEDPITSGAVKAAIDAVIKSVPGGSAIGTFFAYPGAVPPEGAYLLNGQTITNCRDLYPKFWEWLTDNAGEMTAVPVYKPWTMPALSADGTVGGAEYAVQSSGAMSGGYEAYKSFDTVFGGGNTYASHNGQKTGFLTYYSPKKLKIEQIMFQNSTTGTANNRPASFVISGSNDNATWTELASGTYESTSNSAVQTVAVPASKYSTETPGYQYFKFDFVNRGGSAIHNPEITLFGQEYLYIDYAGSGNILSLSDEAYEYTLARTSVCGGFVIDTASGSVRLPTLVNGTLWGADSGTIGQSLAAGLPNIELALKVDNAAKNFYSQKLPEYGTQDNGGVVPNATAEADEAMVTMSSASMEDRGGDLIKSTIYGNSDTVQPPAIRVSWCIQVYNAATALSEQESAQLASQMQMKAQADLGNVTNPTQAFKDMVAGWWGMMPDYNSAVATTAKTFTAPCDCEYFIWLYVEDATSGFYCYYKSAGGTAKTILSDKTWNGSYYYAHLPLCKYMAKGDTISFTGNAFSLTGVYAPLKRS